MPNPVDLVVFGSNLPPLFPWLRTFLLPAGGIDQACGRPKEQNRTSIADSERNAVAGPTMVF
ncbi:MAG TPA: hypothetical protein VF020_11545 [Chthoniobacterales bacterium]